jgi:hypothetical protein
VEINSNRLYEDPAFGGIFFCKYLIASVLIVQTISCYAQPKLVVSDWKKSFGFVKKGELVKIDYDIINKGNQPLLISDADVSCSCTRVEYPMYPILPNQTSTISIYFDTKSVYYRQDRVVSLISNDPAGPTKLRYKGVVLKK